MKKIYWLRRLSLLVTAFGVGAAATGITPMWIKVVLCSGVGGYLLLMAEFDFEQQRKQKKEPTSSANEVSQKNKFT